MDYIPRQIGHWTSLRTSDNFIATYLQTNNNIEVLANVRINYLMEMDHCKCQFTSLCSRSIYYAKTTSTFKTNKDRFNLSDSIKIGHPRNEKVGAEGLMLKWSSEGFDEFWHILSKIIWRKWQSIKSFFSKWRVFC